MNEITARNVQKVTQFRKDGVKELREMVRRMKLQHEQNRKEVLPEKRRVYPEEKAKRDMHLP